MILDVYGQVQTEEITPMALFDSALSELLDALRVSDGTDLVRELAQSALAQPIDAEATEKIGAGRYERPADQVSRPSGAQGFEGVDQRCAARLRIHPEGPATR